MSEVVPCYLETMTGDAFGFPGGEASSVHHIFRECYHVPPVIPGGVCGLHNILP